ncbi:MAG TPA: hypothetical protein VKK61_07815 [Tepidisphaeraceae bacterium]|nr:hypothetical protein [Tepidisphaeraceae bacterium]
MFRGSMLLILIFLGTVAGCTEHLETGYKPQPLGASSAMRRSYYASPFSPEAQAPQMEREQEMNARRPKPGY